MAYRTATRCCLLAATFITGSLTGNGDTPPPPAPEAVGTDFSFGYWPNGWRKTDSDPSPDILCLETGHFGFTLDMDDLSRPRFGLFNDKLDYQAALAAGVNRLDALKPAELAIGLELDGKKFTATTCRSGSDKGVKHLQSTRLWESGRYLQHFDLQDLEFRDTEGNPLACYGTLDVLTWPKSLTLSAELAPDMVYKDGPGIGVSGSGHCIMEQPLDLPHGPGLDPANLTVEVWFRRPEKLHPHNDGWLLCKNNHEAMDGNYGFVFQRGKKIAAILNIGGGQNNSHRIEQHGELIQHLDQWHHLALTYDGKTMRFYLDGRRQGEKTIGKPRKPGNRILRLGQRADGHSGKIRGLYDSLRVWNRALSAAEIAAHAKQPAQLPSRDGLSFERNFDAGPPFVPPAWNNAKLHLALKGGGLEWSNELKVDGSWKMGEQKRLTLACNLPGAPVADDKLAVRVGTPDGQQFPVSFSDADNCRKVLVGNFKRSWEKHPGPDRGKASDYDELLVEVDNRGAATDPVPFLFHMAPVPGITGLVPLLCEQDGTPTGIPVQLSKNWHYHGSYLKAFTMLPAKPGLTRYKLRIVYGWYGTLPSASHAQLSLVGWGGNGRWDQLAIGSWGETFCLDMDMSPTDRAITDVRSLFIRNGKNGSKWDWSDGGWGGDWLGIHNSKDEKLAFSGMKTAYLAHGPCLTDVRYDGNYGPGPEAGVTATVRTLRTDDYARTFHTLRYTFNGEVNADRAWWFKVGGGSYVTPKVAYGNRNGLIKEHDVPQGAKGLKELRPPLTLDGDGPWWVAYPGGHPAGDRNWGTGSRALVIRGYRASLGGKVTEQPTIAFPINTRSRSREQTDVNLLLVPPPGVTSFQLGDSVELDLEWVVVPRVADDYYGPDEAFRQHLHENPRSWKTIHREAIGNALELSVDGGSVTSTYPIVIQAEKDEVSIEIKGGVGCVPIRFDGLTNTQDYTLYEKVGDALQELDQSAHGNDFWQTDLDPASGTCRISFNLPLDGKGSSKWVLKPGP